MVEEDCPETVKGDDGKFRVWSEPTARTSPRSTITHYPLPITIAIAATTRPPSPPSPPATSAM